VEEAAASSGDGRGGLDHSIRLGELRGEVRREIPYIP
jgi:hypothetical protein